MDNGTGKRYIESVCLSINEDETMGGGSVGKRNVGMREYQSHRLSSSGEHLSKIAFPPGENLPEL